MSKSDVPTIDQSPEGDRAPNDVEPDGDALLDGSPVGRRPLMKGIGATAAGGVALGSDYGMVDDADALIGTASVIVGAAVVGWALREYEVVGSNPPAEGQTAGALKQKLYETARTRKSTNASTFVDNRNIISSGLPNTLYAEGKIAAIEQLNQEAAKADVESAAQDAVGKYAATIESNLIKSWNESVNEANSLLSAVVSHPDLTASNWISWTQATSYIFETSTVSITLSDGSTMDMVQIEKVDPVDNYIGSDYINPFKGGTDDGISVHSNSGVDYLDHADWQPLWSDLQTTISDVESGLTTWVNNVYDQVQAGSIEVSELITPRERAKMIAAEDGAAQAIADLYALGVPVDAGNKYTITLADTGATIRGTLAITDDSQTIESGKTYNPSADTFSGDAFFTYDVATTNGDWSAYDQGIDGGVVTFTEEPYDGALYELTTSKNETVTVSSGNFTPVDSNGTQVEPYNSSVAAWEYDLSSKLESDIADVTGVNFFSDVEESKIETIQLQGQFTIEKIVNTESNEEVDKASFEQSEPQTDTNYITQEEWEQLQQQNKELIEKYEESQNTGGGGIDLSQFDMFGLPGEIVALGGAAIALLIGTNS